MFEWIEDPRHLAEFDRSLEIAHEPQLLEVRDVTEVPDDGTHQGVVLGVQVVVGERLHELERASARFVEAVGDLFSHLSVRVGSSVRRAPVRRQR